MAVLKTENLMRGEVSIQTAGVAIATQAATVSTFPWAMATIAQSSSLSGIVPPSLRRHHEHPDRQRQNTCRQVETLAGAAVERMFSILQNDCNTSKQRAVHKQF